MNVSFFGPGVRMCSGRSRFSSPEGCVVKPHHGHGVFETMLLLSRHVDDEEGDEGRESQDQVDGDEGVGELLNLHRAGLTHHHRLQFELAQHRTFCLHLSTKDDKRV